jgi:hypothetical protein
MRALYFRDYIRKFVSSLYFPILLSCLSFLSWVGESLLVWWIFPFYVICTLLPIFSEDGRGYLPLFFFMIILSNKDIHFSGGIPLYLILSLAFFTISLIIYLVVHKPKLNTGRLFFVLLSLYIVFLISYLASVVTNGSKGSTGILYLITMFLVLILYILFNSVLGQGETMPYFSKTYCCFATAAAFETLICIISKNGISFASMDFSLGWSYTRETVSTFLTLSLPFFALLIHERKPFWSLPLLFVLFATILLSTDSGLVCLILFSIPLVILTLTDYSKHSSYLNVLVLLILGITFGLLMGLNTDFSQRIVKAIMRLDIFSDSSMQSWLPYMKSYISQPIFGPSITYLSNEGGTISLCNNTILSTFILGGSFGIAIYLFYEITIYKTFLEKKMQGKSMFLIFLFMIEVAGFIDNTIYNIAILSIFLTAFSVFRQTNRPDEILIHQDFFLNHAKEENPFE